MLSPAVTEALRTRWHSLLGGMGFPEHRWTYVMTPLRSGRGLAGEVATMLILCRSGRSDGEDEGELPGLEAGVEEREFPSCDCMGLLECDWWWLNDDRKTVEVEHKEEVEEEDAIQGCWNT